MAKLKGLEPPSIRRATAVLHSHGDTEVLAMCLGWLLALELGALSCALFSR